MHRRQVLAAAAALVPTAGCLGPGGGDGSLEMDVELPTASLSMVAVDDADIAAELTHHGMADDERELLARVVDEGSATVGWHQEPPLHTQLPVLHEGVVYRLSESIVERRPATNYSVKVDIPQQTPSPAETVQFADLPEADREVFEREGFADGDVVGVGTVFTYTPEQEAASVLVPDPQYDYVDWADGETAEWVVDGSRETEQKRYRFGAERVASASEYGAGIREEYAFELSDLTDTERDVVGTAIEREGGYTVETDATPSSGFERLVDRFRPHEQVAVHDDPDPGLSGRYLVRYDGTVYWTGLRMPEEGATGDENATGG